MNQINLIGNLTAAPETSSIGNETVTSFTVAVNRKQGSDETDFFRVSAWGKQGDACGRYLSKGSKVRVTGSLHITGKQDESGIRRTWVNVNAKEIEFLSFKNPDISEMQDVPEDGIPNEFVGRKSSDSGKSRKRQN